MAIQAQSADTSLAEEELIKELPDGSGYNLPEVSEIAAYTPAKCGQLMDELLHKGLLESPVEGFAKMSIADKRDTLNKAVNLLLGGGEAQPQTEATETAKAMADAVKPKAKESKGAAKKPAKKKPEVKPAVQSNVLQTLEQALPSDDLIAKFASQVEKRIKNRQAAEESIKDLLEEDDFNEFKLGGFLAKLQTNPEWWKESYPSFKDYIETLFGLQYGKAMYCIRIYKKMLTLGVPWAAFGGIGWTKINIMLEQDILTPQNAAEWVEKAKAMNALSLKAAVLAAKKAEVVGGAEVPAGEPSVTTITFKAHPDQKLIINEAVEKAKQAVNTEVATVALEAICQEYMGAGISFTDWKQALTYARKHSDDPALFAGEVIGFLEALCPELVITASLDLKGAQAAA